MADKITPQHRSWNMSRIRSRDMRPEMLVRRLLHSLGYRYRLHRKDLPGKPDLVFPSRRKVIFIHGCFWHQHSSSRCPIVRQPKSNRGYWDEKLVRNVTRDRRNIRRLRAEGWSVLVCWECWVRNEQALSRRLIRFLDRPG